jgi:eukaryotic-like serine/threonine-protein kinase
VDTDRFRRIESLFTTAAGLDTTLRADFLSKECGDDAELRSQVESMLDIDEQPADILRTPVMGAGATFQTLVKRGADVAGPLPTKIGSYRILSVLGEGGFGIVYLAEQDNPRRTVALKVLRPELATRAVLKRFEYEIETLGRLQHPGIAQIYEAGTSEVREGVRRTIAYFAMEYIAGKPLIEFADAAGLGIPERLELLARVCDALQHAHQKGVIHRDLKPANILVIEGATTIQEDSGSLAVARARSGVGVLLSAQPKILDFGVSRAAAPGLARTTAHTGIGQLIGTLPYMSPEQIGGDPNEVDTRSDVYALGVLLFQLLTGRLPYDIDSRSIPEAVRAIQEQAPHRLSTINRNLRGEVELIVATALEKHKSRRYQSAAALADDLRRYLRGEPIAAKRDSALYVLRKQLRRYWVAATLAAIFVGLLAFFGVYASLQSRSFRLLAQREAAAKDEAIHAQKDSVRALRVAEREKSRADAAAEQLSIELAVSNIERGRLLGKTGSLRAAEQLIWPQHLRDPAEPHTAWALWELYSGEPWIATLIAGDQAVSGVRFVPGQDVLMASSADGFVSFWDARDWTLIEKVQAHQGSVRSLEVSPDGLHALTVGMDGKILYWDAPRRIPIRAIDGFNTLIAMACFSPDGTLFAAAGQDSPVARVWNSASGELVAWLQPGEQPLYAVAFAPDSRRLAASSREPAIYVWDDVLGDPDRFATLPLRGNPGFMAFTPDGKRIFAGGNDRILNVWDVEQRRLIAAPQCPNDTVRHVQYFETAGGMVTEGWWTINVWNINTNSIERTIAATDQTHMCDFSADGRYLVIAGSAGMLRVLDRRASDAVAKFPGHATRCATRLSPDGRILAVGDSEGFVTLWDADARRKLARWKAHAGRIHCLRFDPLRPRLCTTGPDRALNVWDLQTGECAQTIAGVHFRTEQSFNWSADGHHFAYMGGDHSVHLLDGDTFVERRRILLDGGEMLSVAFGNRSPILATVCREGPLRVFDFDGRTLAEFAYTFSPWCVDFNADDSLVAVGHWGWKVDLFDWREKEPLPSLEGHTTTVWSVDFHPSDPRLLVSCGSDGLVRLFDVQEKRCLLTFRDLEGSEIISVGFDATGRYVAAASSTGSAIRWDLGHFERHIAGQVEYQINRNAGALGDSMQTDEIRRWVAEVRVRDSTRRGLPAEHELADRIAAWGRLLPPEAGPALSR